MSDLNGSATAFTRRLILETAPSSTTIPEPATLTLFALGIAGLATRKFQK